jgi:Abortive infection C-terminus
MTDTELLEKVQILEDGLVRFSTGGGFAFDGDGGDAMYEELRKLVITDPRSKNATPEFLKANRSLPQFWSFIKGRFAHYRERREFIWAEFGPLHDQLERKGQVPADIHVSDVLSKFDVENVHAVWQKALERRKDDPEGAITSARTLLEAVCKHILDEAGVSYEDGADLPKLYKTVATQLNLAPSQHTEAIFKQILGGCTSVVEGLGALRNKLSDSHGKGPKGAKPDTRHAELAVNLAGSMATFLIETWEHSKPKTT